MKGWVWGSRSQGSLMLVRRVLDTKPCMEHWAFFISSHYYSPQLCSVVNPTILFSNLP